MLHLQPRPLPPATTASRGTRRCMLRCQRKRTCHPTHATSQDPPGARWPRCAAGPGRRLAAGTCRSVPQRHTISIFYLAPYQGVGLPQYTGTFAAQHIDLDVLPDLHQSDLQELGIHAPDHQHTILNAAAALPIRTTTPLHPIAQQRAPAPICLDSPPAVCVRASEVALLQQLYPFQGKATVGRCIVCCQNLSPPYEAFV